LLPAAAAGGFAQAGGDVFQACHFHLESGFAGVGVAMENLDDDAGAVEHLDAGGAFEVAYLAGREFVIDDDEFRLACRLRFGVGRGLGGFEFLAGLGFRRRRHGADDAGAAGEGGEFGQLAAAEQQGRAGALALLRQRADDLIAQGFDQAPEFLEAGFVGGVIDVRRLDADEDGARDGRCGFHHCRLARRAFECCARPNR
jgi:hypothetical protein